VRPPDLAGLIQEYERESYGNSQTQRALTLIDQTLSGTFTQDMFIFTVELESICRRAGRRLGIDADPGLTLILAAYASRFLRLDQERLDVMKVSRIRQLILTLKDGTI
jgi:hypothetical protein